LPADQIDTMLDPGKTHPREAKARLGKMIVEQYHSGEAAEAAAAQFDRVFAKHDLPADIPRIKLTPGRLGIIELITTAGFAKSASDARRLVKQEAVSIDGRKITDIAAEVELKDGAVLKVGKRRFGKIVIS